MELDHQRFIKNSTLLQPIFKVYLSFRKEDGSNTMQLDNNLDLNLWTRRSCSQRISTLKKFTFSQPMLIELTRALRLNSQACSLIKPLLIHGWRNSLARLQLTSQSTKLLKLITISPDLTTTTVLAIKPSTRKSPNLRLISKEEDTSMKLTRMSSAHWSANKTSLGMSSMLLVSTCSSLNGQTSSLTTLLPLTIELTAKLT